MIRVRDILLALLIAAAPLSAAVAQDDDRSRQDKAREETREGQRMELGEIVRRVQSGRDGRMLGVSPRGDTYVVRWEYPGGRIVDITVDARTGRIIGER